MFTAVGWSKKEGLMDLLTILIIVLILAVVFGGFGYSRRRF
jgi:hypothetical protein